VDLEGCPTHRQVNAKVLLREVQAAEEGMEAGVGRNTKGATVNGTPATPFLMAYSLAGM
jgi:hypothetical protein